MNIKQTESTGGSITLFWNNPPSDRGGLGDAGDFEFSIFASFPLDLKCFHVPIQLSHHSLCYVFRDVFDEHVPIVDGSACVAN